MKVGICLADQTAAAGGGFTFQQSVVEELVKRSSPNTYKLFQYHRNGLGAAPAPSQLVQLRRKKTFMGAPISKGYSLESAALEHHIELMWFVGQDFEQVQCPYIYTVWDLEHRNQPWFPEFTQYSMSFDHRELHARYIQKAAAVIAPNEVGLQELQRYYGITSERVILSPHPTPTFAWRAADTIKAPTDRPFLLYPAQFWPHKNHVLLLNALNLLDKKTSKRFDLVFTGSDKGNLGYLYSVAKELKLTDRIHAPGLVSENELLSLYDQAYALVYPSLFGPENLPPLEAMARGTPALVADIPGMRIQLGHAALFFNPLSEANLVDKILELDGDKNIRKHLVEEGLKLAQARTPKIYVDAVEAFIDRFRFYRRTWSSAPWNI